MKLLWATRIGEDWPPQLARCIVATMDRILGPNAAGTSGRLNVNIISSDIPAKKPSGPRYARATEVMKIVRTLLNGEHLDFDGEHYKLKLDPARSQRFRANVPVLPSGGGLSNEARDAAEAADVHLMWPDTMPNVREVIGDMKQRAAWARAQIRLPRPRHRARNRGRSPRLRPPPALQTRRGNRHRDPRKIFDAKNFGVQRQGELRDASDDDGFVEDHLWTGIGRARSGCGAAIVGTPDQVLAKLRAYQAEGIEAFILLDTPCPGSGLVCAARFAPYQARPLQLWTHWNPPCCHD